MTIVCNVEYVLGQQGGRNEKPSAPKCSEGLRKSSKKLEKLFSSFLRGASCPKSPRVAATAAVLFMPESIADVKSAIPTGVGVNARRHYRAPGGRRAGFM